MGCKNLPLALLENNVNINLLRFCKQSYINKDSYRRGLVVVTAHKISISTGTRWTRYGRSVCSFASTFTLLDGEEPTRHADYEMAVRGLGL